MKLKTTSDSLAKVVLCVSSLFLMQCSKNAITEDKLNVVNDVAATPSQFSTGFDRADGTYTQTMATADFGSATISGWNQSRAYITSNWARITLVPNSTASASGMTTGLDISDGSEYEVSYKVRFDNEFDWSRGGKVGFGFLIGDGNTGCNIASDGNGGSVRLMWYNDYTRVYLKPYIYYKDMPATCGNDFGLTFPATGSLERGRSYNVTIYAKSNTGSNVDGWVRILIDGTTLIDQAIRWTTNDTKRLIKTLTFHTFRGGSDASIWGSSKTDYIYYDDVVLRKIQ